MASARQPTASIAVLTTAIVAADVVMVLALHEPGEPLLGGSPLAVAALVPILAAAEYLFVSFRRRGQLDTWNLMEAALAPTLFGFAGPTAMLAVALAQLAGGLLRRNAPLKMSFNVAQWVLAAGVGSALFELLGERQHLPGAALATVVALAGVAVVNQTAMTIVLSVVGATSPVNVLRRRGAEILPGVVIGWSANVLLGLLFVFAFDAHAAAVVLFPVPLIALHIAYRAAVVAHVERARHAGIQDAIRTFGLPLHPAESVEAFVGAVGLAFDARVVCFAMAESGAEPVVHSNAAGETVTMLTRAVLARGGSGHADTADASPIGVALAAGEWQSCVYAVCEGAHRKVAVAVVDQQGLDNDVGREMTLLTGLTREALRVVEKGTLIRELDDERRSLASIVSATSDGIATIGADGVVRSWNPAFERLTGYDAQHTIGTRDVFARLQARTLVGLPVDFGQWVTGGRLPREVRITAADGEPRRLMCAYSRAVDEKTGANVLVVVARDVTAVEEMDALRAQFTRLVEAVPRARAVPTAWSRQLAPVTPVARAEIAVEHVGAPYAGGGFDPYDWYVLPDGAVHFTAVALAAHDARQMQQAIDAMERLRALADDGGAFDDLAFAADDLLGPETGIGARAVVGRYMPDDGAIELAGVLGPNVMVVTPHDGVHELALGPRCVIDLRLALGESIVITSVPHQPRRSARRSGERSIVDRLDRLAHLPARELVASVVGMRAALSRPESIALALRRTGDESTRTWKVPPSVEAVGIFRREVVRWLRGHGVARERLDDVAVIVSELLTNAVGAARTTVEVHALLDLPTLEIAVSDDGLGFEVALDEVPDVDDLFAESGRGLHIVDALASTWTVRAGDDGATVRAQLCVGQTRPESVPVDVVHPATTMRRESSP